MDTKFIQEITVTDPDTGNPIAVEIHKDISTGGIFGVDSSYVDRDGYAWSPFHPVLLKLQEADDTVPPRDGLI